MSQMECSSFSEEDTQLMETHTLGYPLRIYRMRQGYIQLNRIFNLLVFMLIIACTWMLIQIFLRLVEPFIFFHFLIWLSGISILLGSGWYSFIEMRNEEQSRRLLIGEHGLLEIRKTIWKKRVEVVYWKDIRTIRKAFIVPEYLIKRQRGEPFRLLPYVFQNGDELVSLIVLFSKNHRS